MKKSSRSKIVSSSSTLFGKPRIKGSRVSVEQVLACLAEGWTNKQIIKDFEISEEDIQACLEYAYRALSRTHLRPLSKVYA